MLPAYGRMQQNAGAVRCASNLRQISTYINHYVGDNNGYLPRASYKPDPNTTIKWFQQLTPYFGFNYEQTNSIQQPGLKVFV
jgi:hypothetical protein